MANESIDLSVPDKAKDPKAESKLAQFKRDLSHILIHSTEDGEESKGPNITVGPYDLQFMERAPVTALAELIGGENRVNAMRQYVLLSLEESSREGFETLLGLIDLEGLGEIISAMGEGYSSFPDPS